MLNAAKHPSAPPPASTLWILRCAQHDRIHRILRQLRAMLLFSVVCPLSSVFATITAPTDLGPDLSYLRVHSLSDSAPALHSTLSASRAFVLDLRYTTADEASLAVLRSALAQHPKAAPLFILLSPVTPAAVVDAINRTPGACISLGIASSRSARIEVKADAESDRRAYDALDAGTPLDTLISGKIEKERFDEASLVREFKNGSYEAEQPVGPAGHILAERPATPATGAVVPKQVEPPTDRVLQRAVHLHRALLALKAG